MFLSENRPLRLFVLCVLYLAQGIPFGFVTIALVAFLASRGASTSAIATVTAMTSLPWAFKWLWGPFIDAFGLPSMGRRRPWILLAQALMAVTLSGMVLVPDLGDNIRLLAGLIFVHNVFASMQDVATDALAVDILAERERGSANGLMYGSSYLGTFLGGALSGWISLRFGLPAAIATLGGLLVAIMLVPLLVRERPGDSFWPRRGHPGTDAPRPRGFGAAVGEFLSGAKAALCSGPAAALALVYAGLLKIPTGVVAVIPLVLATRELGWSEEQYIALGSGGVWLGLAGALAGGFLSSAFGAHRTAVISALLLAGTWVAFALLPDFWADKRFLSGYILTETFLVGVVAVASFAIFMGVAHPRIAATQFTAYMAVLNLSMTAGTKLASWLDAHLSVTAIYLSIAALQVGVTFLIPFLRRPAHIDPC